MMIVPFTAEELDRVSLVEQSVGGAGWTRAQFEKELSIPFSRFFVLQKDRNILGYGGYWKVADEAQMTNIAILPDERRQGKGEFLLNYLIHDACKAGCRTMTLEVRSQNAGALALYRKAGFIQQTVRRQAYSQPTDDAVLMQKQLIS